MGIFAPRNLRVDDPLIGGAIYGQALLRYYITERVILRGDPRSKISENSPVR